jgi:hypothetical protein
MLVRGPLRLTMDKRAVDGPFRGYAGTTSTASFLGSPTPQASIYACHVCGKVRQRSQ